MLQNQKGPVAMWRLRVMINWRASFLHTSFLLRALGTGLALAIILIGFKRFLAFVEERPGAFLADPILAMIPPQDISVLTFLLIYGAIITAVLYLLEFPELLLRGLQAYGIMVVIRMLVMFAAPLDPPAGIIPLVDPFVESAITSKPLLKDLFFSGHTATVSLLMVSVQHHRKLRNFFLFMTVCVGSCVLVQHVHYFIDVASAPFFAYGSYQLAGLLRPKNR